MIENNNDEFNNIVDNISKKLENYRKLVDKSENPESPIDTFDTDDFNNPFPSTLKIIEDQENLKEETPEIKKYKEELANKEKAIQELLPKVQEFDNLLDASYLRQYDELIDEAKSYLKQAKELENIDLEISAYETLDLLKYKKNKLEEQLSNNVNKYSKYLEKSFDDSPKSYVDSIADKNFKKFVKNNDWYNPDSKKFDRELVAKADQAAMLLEKDFVRKDMDHLIGTEMFYNEIENYINKEYNLPIKKVKTAKPYKTKNVPQDSVVGNIYSHSTNELPSMLTPEQRKFAHSLPYSNMTDREKEDLYFKHLVKGNK